MPDRRRWRPVGIAAMMTVAAAPLLPAAYVEGPVPGMTGGFGEPTCHQCHFDNRLNDPAGSLSVSGLPDHYTPGARYVFTVSLTRRDMSRGGFQLSARFDDSSRSGRQAGSFDLADPRLQLVAAPSGDVRYVQHTKSGSAASTPGELRWLVPWIAPDDGGTIVVHVSANASNDDDSPLGDFIYTAVARGVGSGGLREGH
jgi:hypothetical protein